jgi:hypothetical protein
MTGQPPSGPLKYKVTAPAEAPPAKRLHLPPPNLPPPEKPRLSHSEAVFRVAIVVVILVSAGVAYWSFFERLAPLQKESRSMLTRVSNMSAQLDQKERRWTSNQVQEINARYGEVYGRLFPDHDQAAGEEWMRQVLADAEPLALHISVDVGQSTPQVPFTNNVRVTPAAISLEVLPAAGEAQGKSPYERVLRFCQQLAAHGKRADLAEVTIQGGVGSVKRASLVFNLWVGDLGADAALTTAANTNNQSAK